MNNQTRRYAKAWELLKTNKSITMQLTVSQSPERRRQAIKGLKRALGKEKYRDEDYKFRQPKATLDAEVFEGENPTTVQIRFTLTEFPSLEEI